MGIKPPIWLVIGIRDKSPIELWPRSVDGGLLALWRHARNMRRMLHEIASQDLDDRLASPTGQSQETGATVDKHVPSKGPTNP
jgi:hypothetical protein